MNAISTRNFLLQPQPLLNRDKIAVTTKLILMVLNICMLDIILLCSSLNIIVEHYDMISERFDRISEVFYYCNQICLSNIRRNDIGYPIERERERESKMGH